MYEYYGIITNVVDGDTFDMDVDLGFHIHIHIRVRLLGIDTPEKRGSKEKELGLICTEFARKYFLNEKVKIYSMGEDKSANTDSFGRWLVYLDFIDYPFDFNLENIDYSITSIYNNLGINKLWNNYDVNKVLALKKYI